MEGWAVTYLPCHVTHTLRQSPPSHMHTLSGSHHPPMCTHLRQSPTYRQSPPSHVMPTHSQAVTTMHTLSGSHHPPTCTHSQAVTTLPHAHTLRQSPPSHMHTLSGSHHPPTCTHSPAVTTLPHAHTLRLSHHPPTCTHSPAVTTLPHAHTLRQSPPSHMPTHSGSHTLSGSHLPPMSHSGSHHPASTCTQSGNHPSHVMSNQAVTTLPCHVTHTITVMDPKLMLIQFLQFV